MEYHVPYTLMCTKLPEMKCSSELIFKSSNAREKKLYKRKFPSMHKTLKCSLMKHLTDKQTIGKYVENIIAQKFTFGVSKALTLSLFWGT